MRLDLRTDTADDTRAVGAAIAAVLEPRDAIALSGDLGAGKTTLVQGLARGLGIEDQVVSPTFTLVREYRGRLDLAHVDVYRLEHEQDVVDLGLEELGDGLAVLAVEWGDAVAALLPEEHLEVELTTEDPTGASERRRIRVSGNGALWASRWEELAIALAPWGTTP
ncbi:MAG TPA: tRNA (adenosine(37)-N6)-threonylcarbamoyltransferase complex ATPase subunit type 1 TsaE [Actinomycetota bacterium]|jgi:tRNA threonylcarbamoyladenosine biosynthesis protein TsaE